MANGESKVYPSKIIRVGALLPDTKLMLANWNSEADVPTNLRQIQETNLFGKASRARVKAMLTIFKQRYLSDTYVLSALHILVQQGVSAEVLDRILYFLTLQDDLLLHDVVLNVFAPMVESGRQDVTVRDVDDWIKEQIAAGKTQRQWNDETRFRVSQGVMATMRDFGVLEGVVNKRIASMHLPTLAFCFIAFLLNRKQRSGEQLLNDPEWQLFFLQPQTVERFFLEAHQERLLTYYAAGRVIRIEFPTDSIEEYAHALAQRTH